MKRMTLTGWQRIWVRIVTTVIMLTVMAMIFAFSTENAEQSDQRSGIISIEILKVFHPDYNLLDPLKRKEIYDTIQHVVRKSAHFLEYTLLGFMIRLCLESWFGHRTKASRPLEAAGACAGTVYACTDELHQLLIDGRSGQWTDVIVDGCGVFLGIKLGTLFIIKLGQCHIMKKEQGDGNGLFQKQ